MHGIFQDSCPSCRRRRARFLAFSFFIGMLCGLAASLGVDIAFLSLMRGIVYDSVSIVCLILVLLIPLLVSLSAVFVDAVLLFPICFVRAFLFAFVHLAVIGCFGAGGWLIRWLLLFSDCAALPVLYFFWHRRLSGEPVSGFSCAIMLCVIGFLDFYAVTPFGAGLLIYAERVMVSGSCWI